MRNIRNFSIIAHIDHGKSTLSDRFIELCGGLEKREMAAQVLDSMDLERERGITIKAQSVSLKYTARDGQNYQLNFIDTPGHVDFSYEVSRSLAACEGALLVVDAAQGVEAQTIANCYKAVDQGLEILPVINKIDLPSADPAGAIHDIEDIIGLDVQDVALVSAKTGAGIDDLLELLIRKIPAPAGDPAAPLQALIIDSWFDNYVGVVSLVRVVNGELTVGSKVRIMSTEHIYLANDVGVFTPKMESRESLGAGEVGYLVAGIKEIDGAPVGDTVTLETNSADGPLPGFRPVMPRVFAGLFPVQSDQFELFRDALQKLRLNDAALNFEPESSGVAVGAPAHAAAARRHRPDLPVLSSAAPPLGPGQRGAAGADRGRRRRRLRAAPPGAAYAGRPGRSCGRGGAEAERWGDAAGGDLPRPAPAAPRAAGRRAHRRPGR